ncbi:MAG: 16S rRNA (cytosine(967)-C(5))-methyltransferase RsmB [Gammaproteobacteria bacterium]|nr:16S rRNA (cytosine(967)-C(5))-methyltransferase RsmB [Gammaproteobacteria bacterium]MYD77145.1 16S rRNA (cytosine(967)-C(5))-methyltransferase RsmB [Gammaproteobacteria bacterium]
MHPIAAAAEVVFRVVDHGESLDRLLQNPRFADPATGPAFREMVYGTCRHCPLIDSRIGMLLERPLRKRDRIVHFVLAVGIYQLEHMNIPDYAVLNETVEAVSGAHRSWARKLVNGVLRNYLRNRDRMDLSSVSEHEASAFPKFLFDRIKADWPDCHGRIVEASNSRPPLTLRVNRRKLSRQQGVELMKGRGVHCVSTPDSPTGIGISPPMPVEQIPGFLDGAVSVQDESAQLAAAELEPGENLDVLDACAAPGGKTGQLVELFPGSCRVTAVDLASRTDLIRQNLERLGLAASVVAGDLLDPGSWWDGRLFDRILLDVPCSGSGVIRRHPDIKYRRNEEGIRRFHALQVSMLESAWAMLGAGGILLYVTCSLFHLENDEAIAAFANRQSGLKIEPVRSIPGRSTRFGIQRLPGVHSGDGFYYCKIRKSAHAAGA